MKKYLVVLLVTMAFLQLKAQSDHVTCVPYCELFSTVKVKNSVSCIDGVCPVCLKKKEEARKKYQEQEKLAAEKRVRDDEKRKQEYVAAVEQQKKALAVMRQKQKEGEMILVAPKPKVDNTPAPAKALITLNARDREILELSKTKRVFAAFLSGREYFNEQWGEYPTPVIKVYYEENKQYTVLKNLELKTTVPYKRVSMSGLENGYFNAKFDEDIADLVSIDGSCLFNDRQIRYISNYGNGLYLIGKKIADDASIDYYEFFDINSRKKYPFPDGLVSDYIVLFGKGVNVCYTTGGYSDMNMMIINTAVKKGRSLKIMATWDLEAMRKNGSSFYDNYKISSGPNKGRSLKHATHGSPPEAYLQNKDKCRAMFLIFHNITNGTNKYGGETHVVNNLSVYGFDAVNGKFILFDRIDFGQHLDYYHILTGYWFGQMR